MNEFEFRPDRTTDYGVSCPWASKKYPYRPYNGENGVSTFSLLFLIGSFGYFHVTRTSIKAWMSLNFLKWDLTLAHWTQVSDRCPLGYLFSFFFLFSFQALKFFVTLFSGTVRPTLYFTRYLKLVTHMNSGWLYRVYWNQAAAAYKSLYFFIFHSLQLSYNKFFIVYFSGMWGLQS